jgi:integrase
LKSSSTPLGYVAHPLMLAGLAQIRSDRQHPLRRTRRLALGRGRLTDDALLFARLDDGPESPHGLSKQWSAAAADIELANVSFHGLRHTHASQLIDAGVDVVKIRKRLGHASPTITLEVYAHLFSRREDKSA